MINKELFFKEPFGLYLHVPFCQSKCRYCDFYSLQFREELGTEYLEALLKEIEILAQLLPLKKVKTIYLGGGTPSLLTLEEIARLLKHIYHYFSCPPGLEITLEANPSSLNEEKIKGYKDLGINRLSLGVQSFNEQELRFLGRLHTKKEALEVISLTRKYFTNYNLDLIFALPGQKLEEWLNSLKTALSFVPPHLSLYNLQLEEGTQLGKWLEEGKITPIADELDAQMYLQAREILTSCGYQHYEISNFAQGANFSQHNLIYWRYEPYLGLGPAAHSFNGGWRWHNPAKLSLYLQKLANGQLAWENPLKLSSRERMAELVFLALRLAEGLQMDKFKAYFARDFTAVFAEELNKLLVQGLISFDGQRVKLTEKGLLLGNEVFQEFL